ncbi:MAG TPA: ferritin-like domain-containing protein [Flavobacterium sp.]|nr:ferritin-like domain-containing protein [Flavobacterium sp.]HRA72751.1 ferritin-like domain-containing protein [Flavobacterium sp.]
MELLKIICKNAIVLLSVVLADEMTLYVKTRKFHWNVAGLSFMELHKLFESQYTELEAIIDNIDVSADENLDAGTADLVTGIIQQHETTAWILRKYLA